MSADFTDYFIVTLTCGQCRGEMQLGLKAGRTMLQRCQDCDREFTIAMSLNGEMEFPANMLCRVERVERISHGSPEPDVLKGSPDVWLREYDRGGGN